MTQLTNKVRFADTDCVVAVGKYGNGRVALNLFDPVNDEPVVCVTVNLPESEIDEGEIVVKTWFENEDMWEALHAAGIIYLMPEYIIETGHVRAPVARLTDDVRKQLTQMENDQCAL